MIGVSFPLAMCNLIVFMPISHLLALRMCDFEPQVSLQDMIDNVRHNEALYDNIEVVLNQTYRFAGFAAQPVQTAGGMTSKEVVQEDAKTRHVGQQAMFRFERNGSQTYPDKSRGSIDRIRAFDGKTTRLYDQNAIGNIIAGRSEDSFVRPHTILLQSQTVPLSLKLQGHEAWATHPAMKAFQGLASESTYQGEVEFQGLKCHKVWVTNVAKDSGQVSSRVELWLAEDRNYLALRSFVFDPKSSKDIPVAEGVIDDLREIAPGIWFPYAAHHTSYEKDSIAREGRQKVRWRRDYQVEKASLDPNYDVAFFRDVPFPDGTAVYEIENGKIIRSYRQGAPDAPGGPTSESWIRRWWILWANVAVALLVIGFLVVRRVVSANR